jgi:YebC/PmpR family DNA-binding regulatory protein
VIAKAGGLDPTGNLSLRSIIERAKKDQVPSHVIEKAIEKAKGGAGENFELARYEGYGPGNCMVIIECLTDNPSRTFNDVRLCFSKTKTKIGTQGSVSHMFDHLTILMFSGQDEEAVLDALLMADVDVVDIENEEGMLTVFAPHTESFKAKKSLNDAFGEIEYEVDEIQFIAQNTAPLVGDDVETFETFTAMLNDLDDVQSIYHNVE